MNVRRDHAFRQQGVPGDVAGIERQNERQTSLPHGRAQAVGADQHVGANRGTVGKMRHDPLRTLLEGLKTLAAMISIRLKGIAQDAVHALPRGEHLWAFERRRHHAGLIEDFSRAHGDAEISCFELKRIHARYQFGLHDDKVEKSRQPLDGLPQTDASGKAKFSLTIDKQPTTTRPLDSSAAVVEVKGLRNVGVFVDNIEVGRTGRGGRLLVGDLLPFLANRVSIRESDLPFDYAVPDPVRLVCLLRTLVGLGAFTRRVVRGPIAFVVG